MCLNEKCFNFDDFSGKKVSVVICGPGYLEYPWALEITKRLASSKAIVSVVDLSDIAHKYAMRLNLFKFQLPVSTRKVLRRIFLKKSNLIENLFKSECKTLGIAFTSYISKKISQRCKKNKQITIDELSNEVWGSLRAKQIVHSFFSSKAKSNLSDECKLRLRDVLDVKQAILECNSLVGDLIELDCDAFFLANGRQPVAAELTTNLRAKNKQVYLYESAGGYIYPDALNLHLDIWETSPANFIETQSKISCFANRNKETKISTVDLMDSIRTRRKINYNLNYLTDAPTSFDKNLMSNSRNYAFFASSDWELSVLMDDSCFPDQYNSQFEAFQALLNGIGKSDKVFLRLHPSDPNNHGEEDKRWNDFELDRRVVLIPPESRLDSYRLAAEMDAIFVWVSFLGYELALRELPIAVMGEAVYGPTLGTNWIRSNKELYPFIQHPTKVSSNQLDYYAKYLEAGGFQITSSITTIERRIIINGIKADSFRKFFLCIPEKFRLAIS